MAKKVKMFEKVQVKLEQIVLVKGKIPIGFIDRKHRAVYIPERISMGLILDEAGLKGEEYRDAIREYNAIGIDIKKQGFKRYNIHKPQILTQESPFQHISSPQSQPKVKA